MRSLRGRTAEYGIDLIGRSAQEFGERAIGRLFAPMAEHVENEEQCLPYGWPRVPRQVGLDHVEENRRHGFSLSVCSADRLHRQSFEDVEVIEEPRCLRFRLCC